MDLTQLVELATVVASRSDLVILQSAELPDDALFRFGSRSQARLRGWRERLQAYPKAMAEAEPTQRRHVWAKIEPVLFDVLTSELITRLWTAVLRCNDELHRRVIAGPIGNAVFRGHLHARQDVLRILATVPAEFAVEARRVDRLRRRLERWSDLLIGHLVLRFDVADLVHDLGRAQEFGKEFREAAPGRTRDQMWELYRLSLHAVFRDLPPVEHMAARLRSEILQSILACFQFDRHLAEGAFPASWLSRLTTAQPGNDDADEPETDARPDVPASGLTNPVTPPAASAPSASAPAASAPAAGAPAAGGPAAGAASPGMSPPGMSPPGDQKSEKPLPLPGVSAAENADSPDRSRAQPPAGNSARRRPDAGSPLPPTPRKSNWGGRLSGYDLPD